MSEVSGSYIESQKAFTAFKKVKQWPASDAAFKKSQRVTFPSLLADVCVR